MSESARFRTFEEFWPFYVKEHSLKSTRWMHFAGTTMALGTVAAAVLLRKRSLLFVAPVMGYGPAWISHFFIEKNRPATFKYPRWSLMADFKMYGMILRGTMDAEVERVLREDAQKHEDEVAAQAKAQNGANGTAEHVSAAN